MMSLYGGNFCDYSYVRSTPPLIMWAKWKVDEWLGPRTVYRMICIMQINERFSFAWKYWSFQLDNKWNSPTHWKLIGKKEYVQMYSTFLIFTEMTGICLITLEPLEQVEPGTLEPHKNVWFVVPKPEKPVLFHLSDISHRFFHTNISAWWESYWGGCILTISRNRLMCVKSGTRLVLVLAQTIEMLLMEGTCSAALLWEAYTYWGEAVSRRWVSMVDWGGRRAAMFCTILYELTVFLASHFRIQWENLKLGTVRILISWINSA